MTNKPTMEDWEENFNSKFLNHGEFVYNRGGYPVTCGEIKQFIKDLLARQLEEIKERLKPSLDKLTPALQVNDKWAEAHGEFGGEIVFDDVSIENELPRSRPIRVIYYSPLRDLQEVIKIGAKLKNTGGKE